MLGNRYLDSALAYQTSPFDISYYNGLKYIRAGKIDEAKRYLDQLISDPHLTLHQEALATSTLSDIYIQKGQIDYAIKLLVRAAIADIKSSTKETSAIFHLSNILFQQGDLKNASNYIEKAVKDAVSYGARQRKMQMSAILPLIEGEKVARVEHEKRTLTNYAVVVTLLLILSGYLTYQVYRQIRKLKLAQKALTRAHAEQQEMNRKLEEANKIKEEYIGFFFNAHTAFYEKMEWFVRKAEQKITSKKPDELSFLLKNLDIKQERVELLKNFDAIFLKIFPHFIEEYNQLFNPEDRVQLKESGVLNTDQRIFALYRLGIHDNDKIASILGYSVNTINTYKTRIKNKSLVPNELFEDKIMSIKSLG
jgi:tetratricopeptide (TPR) repeat protein